MSRQWKIVIWISTITAISVIATLVIGSVVISRHARDWVDDWLTQQFKSDVDLESFRVSIPFPLVQAEGEKLALHFKGRQDLPPLIGINHFVLRASFWGFLRNPRRVQYVHLDGLQLNIPPRGSQQSSGSSGLTKAMKGFHDMRFGEIVSENAVLKILTDKPGKDPLEFDIARLNLHSAATTGALIFRATLTNPKPPGGILSNGTFGPWNADDPKLTPISGTYTFEKADLGVFPGISGILSSEGKYDGALDKIHVAGTTDIPDFKVNQADHPVHLTTTFDATVDGTNGDTYLHPVVAKFRNTTLTAQGSVEGTKGKKGKTITLDVTTGQARIEDLLQFALKVPATMTGPIQLKTNFVLTPGPQDIPDRLALNGSFALNPVHFTSGTVQQKVDNLSKRSLGKPNEVDNSQTPISTDDVASEMRGDFRLGNGTLAVSKVGFQIPGATVHVDGTYNLEQEDMDFHAIVDLQAKLSQTVTGTKSFFLKILDPFFSKNGKGTVLPVKITGSIKNPKYGLDFGHKKEADKASK